MAFKLESDGDTSRIVIEGEMTIYTAGQTKDELLAPLATCRELEVDLSGVTEIDAAGLQLLVMLKREAAKVDKTLCFFGHSQAVLDLLDLANLGGFFGDPVLLSSKAKRGEQRA